MNCCTISSEKKQWKGTMTKSYESNPYAAKANKGYGNADWIQAYALQALGLETARLADAQETANMLKVLEMRYSVVSIGRIGNDALAEKVIERMGL